MARPIQPGLACLTGRHLDIDVHDDSAGNVAASWCLWCGGGVSDPDRITDDGQPVGFTPRYQLRIPAGWHRLPDDP